MRKGTLLIQLQFILKCIIAVFSALKNSHLFCLVEGFLILVKLTRVYGKSERDINYVFMYLINCMLPDEGLINVPEQCSTTLNEAKGIGRTFMKCKTCQLAL